MISAEQKAFKVGKIGASSVAAALGISPFQTKAGLYHELKGNIERKEIGVKGIVGNMIEPIIIHLYELETGNVVDTQLPGSYSHPSQPPVGTYVHPDYPWFICHLDGVVTALNRNIEIKNVGPYMVHHWGQAGDPKGVPLYVVAQCTAQAILGGFESSDVAAFFGGNELRVYTLDISKEAKKTVEHGVVEFWDNYIKKNIQPEVTEDDLDLIKELYWRITKDKIIRVDGTKTALMFDDYRRIKAEIKELEKKADRYKAAIQDVMKDATVLMRGDDIEFTFKKSKDKPVIDWETALEKLRVESGSSREFCDQIIKDFTTIKPGSRVFLDKQK